MEWNFHIGDGTAKTEANKQGLSKVEILHTKKLPTFDSLIYTGLFRTLPLTIDLHQDVVAKFTILL